MRVIGTAGHVDHGKSALVQALTGTDTDRLREEKERGMTIELGFALLTLPSGAEAGIVDVPGHERFIKTMLAGVGGIHLALLVVAADEGVMPQTREHLAIIDLLGIERGVIALTKADLVDAPALENAERSIREALTGTSLAGAPIVPCSAATGAGLDPLLAAIESRIASVPAPRDLGRPRLPVDRAFTMPGFGTIVTGTLTGGSLRIGDEVELVPGNAIARIRGLQSHGRNLAAAEPGGRTAINLAGIDVADIRRGVVLAMPGMMRATQSADVRLRAVSYLDRPLRHNVGVTFHTGAAEAAARLVLLDVDELPEGESCWAQLRLAGPLAAESGDRFVVRDPNGTIGGGTIVATGAPRHRRFYLETIAALQAGASGFSLAGLVAAIRKAGATVEQIDSVLAEYHTRQPLRLGVPREELRSRVGLSSRAFDALIAALAQSGHIRVNGALVARAEFAPSLTDAERAAANAYIAALRVSPYAPAVEGAPPAAVLDFLESRGEIVRAGEVVFAADAYEAVAAAVVARLRETGAITLAEVRDMFGTSRRYAQALLERLDTTRVTKRVGDVRVLR